MRSALEGLLIVLMSAAVLNVAWQVLTRFVLGTPSSWTEEAARFLLIWIGLLGACLAADRGLHSGIDLATQRLSVRGRAVARRVVASTVALFGILVLGIGGGRLVSITGSLGQRSAALDLPLSWVYVVLPLSGALLTLISLRQIAGGER